MSSDGSTIDELPHAMDDGGRPAQAMAGKRLAVFLDYDGTLTPIVDRPEDAIISDATRQAVRELAARCTVCVVSGRDRAVVQRLMGVDDLVVAGSHGFDIWSPTAGSIEHEEGSDSADLLAAVTERLRAEVGGVNGAVVEPKRSSVAVHYRLVDEQDRPRIKEIVDGVVAAEPEALRVTPGKMVYEIQPKIDWDKGRAVLYLLEALGLDGDDVLPLYVGDDITDEDAFRALSGRGIGILVADPADPEVSGRRTAAHYVLRDPAEVKQFLAGLAR